MQISSHELTLYNGQQILAEIQAALKNGDYTLDFKHVKRTDSVVLALLLAARRHLDNLSVLKIVNPPPQLDALIQAYGVQSLFN